MGLGLVALILVRLLKSPQLSDAQRGHDALSPPIALPRPSDSIIRGFLQAGEYFTNR
jgi:hypothetical protein